MAGGCPRSVYRVKLRLERPEGTYAVLSFELLDTNSGTEIMRYAKLCEELRASLKVDFTYEQHEDVGAEIDVFF